MVDTTGGAGSGSARARRPEASSFETVLAAALDRRGISLSRARQLLRERGHEVSIATLSYWRSGQRRPERSSSLEAVDELEAILLLPPGSLRTGIGPSRRLGPQPSGPVSLSALMGATGATEAALCTLGLQDVTETFVEELVVVDVDIDARGQESQVRVRARLRALVDGVDRYPVVIDAGAPVVEPVRVLAERGCVFGRSVDDREHGLLVVELCLERAMRSGETASFEYVLALAETPEAETSTSYSVARQVGELELWVRFDEQRLPASAELYTRTPAGEGTQVAVELADSSTVSHAVRRFGPGTVGIRWTW